MVICRGHCSWWTTGDGMKPPTPTRPLAFLLSFNHISSLCLLTRKRLSTEHLHLDLLIWHFSQRFGRHPLRAPSQPPRQETRR